MKFLKNNTFNIFSTLYLSWSKYIITLLNYFTLRLKILVLLPMYLPNACFPSI